MAIIKIQVNAPITGIPTSAERVQGEYGPQVKLRGNFNGDAQGTVYINETCEGQMRTLGVLADGPNGGLVISRAVPITVLRTEENGKKRTNLSLASGGTPSPVNHAPTNGHAAPAHPANNAAERPGETFKRLKITMAACLKASREAWIASLPAGEIPPIDGIASTAHTLFIAADRRNCLSPLPKPPAEPATDSQKHEIDSVSECLATRHVWTRERLQAEILGATQATELAKLTEPQAKTAIDFLQRKLHELDEAAAVAAAAQQQRAAATASPDEEIPW